MLPSISYDRNLALAITEVAGAWVCGVCTAAHHPRNDDVADAAAGFKTNFVPSSVDISVWLIHPSNLNYRLLGCSVLRPHPERNTHIGVCYIRPPEGDVVIL